MTIKSNTTTKEPSQARFIIRKNETIKMWIPLCTFAFTFKRRHKKKTWKIYKYTYVRTSSNSFVWISNQQKFACKVNYLEHIKHFLTSQLRRSSHSRQQQQRAPFNLRNHAEICKWWMEYFTRISFTCWK